METIESENIIEQQTKKQRTKRAPWRTTVHDDGTITYNNKPIDPEYHNKYYHKKRRAILCSKVCCDLCGSILSKAQLTRHKQTSKKCGKKQNERIVSLLQ